MDRDSPGGGLRPPRTVRVRIAVAVDEKGQWSAIGWSTVGGQAVSDEDMRDSLSRRSQHDLGPSPRISCIIADVPMPEPKPEKIVGAVEEDGASSLTDDDLIAEAVRRQLAARIVNKSWEGTV